MPILLPEEKNNPLPKMYPVRQVFSREQVDDIPGTVRAEMGKEEIAGKIEPGMNVAIAVGSRGIKNLSTIVKTVISCVRKAGANPYVVAAMGSHGGGTGEGQLEILDSYGITEEKLGVPVVAQMDTVCLGKTNGNVEVYFDKVASEADLVIPINRIKLHTDFPGPIQSGLCKMLVIGLGNHVGCTRMHEVPLVEFGKTIIEATQIILEKVQVGLGIAVVENAYDETALIEAIVAEELIHREEQLLKFSSEQMPRLMIPEIDVLIVEEIGKDISGAGFDPNILGKSYIREEFTLPVPKISRMVLNNLSQKSHGNGLGMGVFDVMTKKAFEQLDYQATYANAIASRTLEDARIPLIVTDEEEALRIAIQVLEEVDKEKLKIVKIKNTLKLDEIEISEALLSVVDSHPYMTRNTK